MTVIEGACRIEGACFIQLLLFGIWMFIRTSQYKRRKSWGKKEIGKLLEERKDGILAKV